MNAPAAPSAQEALTRTTGQTGLTSSVESRALELLGSGVSAAQVAAALGVTESRISQLLSQEDFAAAVSTLRYENLQKHNLRDNRYDEIEDKLLDKLDRSIPLIFKPETLLRAISTVNGAKRRGQSSPDQVVNQKNIVNLLLPSVIAEKFTLNVNSQVIRAGDQELHTIASGALLQKIEQIAAQKEVIALENQNQQNQQQQNQESNGDTADSSYIIEGASIAL